MGERENPWIRQWHVGHTWIYLLRRWLRPSYRKMPSGVSLSAAWQFGPLVGMVWKGTTKRVGEKD